MKTINTCLLFPGLLLISTLSGCSEPIQLYSGPRLPRNRTASLDTGFKFPDIEYLIIDGDDLKESPFWAGEKVTMLPGKHEIKWAIKEPRGNFTYRGHGILNARAAMEYRVWCTYKAEESTANQYGAAFKIAFYRTWIGDSRLFTEDWEDFIYPDSTDVNPSVLF